MQTGTIHSLVEYTHIHEMQAELRRKLSEANRTESGQTDSLRGMILGLVVAESYERARDELMAYVEMKSSYPAFQERAQRYMQHCVELIQAIQTKREFPGLATLSLAKQQEIHEKVIEHFEDLKQHLKQIEKVEREQKLSDVRSTVWVVRMFCYCTIAVIGTLFIIDVQRGEFLFFAPVMNGFLDAISERVVNLVHF